MKVNLAKANGSLPRAHWLLQKDKHVALCIKPKRKFVNNELYAIESTSLKLWHKRLRHISEKGL